MNAMMELKLNATPNTAQKLKYPTGVYNKRNN